mmetsp:Transcript_25056/g.41581  ORF Transcript_25056/g.41581 Transcript_25056/m.41581 type:complete len:88 (+) Transcript_25056:55-318(+)
MNTNSDTTETAKVDRPAADESAGSTSDFVASTTVGAKVLASFRTVPGTLVVGTGIMEAGTVLAGVLAGSRTPGDELSGDDTPDSFLG